MNIAHDDRLALKLKAHNDLKTIPDYLGLSGYLDV